MRTVALAAVALSGWAGFRIWSTLVRTESWWEHLGAWGVFVLLVFTAVTVAGAFAAWTTRRRLLAVAAVVLLAMSFVTGFSIGSAYLPAAGCLVALAVAEGLRAGFTTPARRRRRAPDRAPTPARAT